MVTHPTLRSTGTIVGVFEGRGLAGEAYHRALIRSVEVARGTTSYLFVGAASGGALAGSRAACWGPATTSKT